mmetsp:Transcript_17419/g.50235  ORF Transcript_17419/g.50235 Transcript_17419/m.50235 type:complete len:165 (-) Transcript_17419:23-517(-)
MARLEDRLAKHEGAAGAAASALAEQCRREASDIARQEREAVERLMRTTAAEEDGRLESVHRLVLEQGSQLAALNCLLWGSPTGQVTPSRPTEAEAAGCDQPLRDSDGAAPGEAARKQRWIGQEVRQLVGGETRDASTSSRFSSGLLAASRLLRRPSADTPPASP